MLQSLYKKAEKTLDLEQLKARQATAMKVGQDLVNEQLRVEGEYRSLGKLIAELETKEDSGTPVPVTVVEPTPDAALTTEADADGEPTPAD